VQRTIGLLILVMLLAPPAFTQKRSRTEEQPPPKKKTVRVIKRKTITLRYGLGIPLSDKAVTAFWAPGGSVSAEFLLDINTRFSLGIGIDAARFGFREDWFTLGYPNIPVHALDLYWWNIYFASKFSLPTKSPFTPFGEIQVGISRVTPAEYREVINGVRVIYYDIKGSTRLTFGLGAGVDFRVAWWLALQAEGKLTYAYNDPQRNIVLLTRGGLAFFLY